MDDDKIMQGGCLCGAVRYEISGEPLLAEYCHCRMCQKAAGAAAPAWMDLQLDQVTWTAGRPLEFESTATGRRGFCARCGSTLSFRDTGHPEYVSLAIVSLDDPNRVRPTRHIYTESQVGWLSIDDDCERYRQGPGSSPG
jgi:hypothetical protein